jgi:hypothetical protein
MPRSRLTASLISSSRARGAAPSRASSGLTRIAGLGAGTARRAAIRAANLKLMLFNADEICEDWRGVGATGPPAGASLLPVLSPRSRPCPQDADSGQHGRAPRAPGNDSQDALAQGA